MKRIFIGIICLTLINATALMSMDNKKVITNQDSRKMVDILALAAARMTIDDKTVDNNNSAAITSPPVTPRTPRTPQQECACRIMARHCRMHPSERVFDDCDHPLKSPKDQPRSGDIPSPKSASPSKLSPKTIAGITLTNQSPDTSSQSSNNANNQN